MGEECEPILGSVEFSLGLGFNGGGKRLEEEDGKERGSEKIIFSC